MRNNLDGAVLLLNLGSPKELTKRSVKEYLRIFLSDDYVVDLPKVLQQLILYLFILPFRPRKTLHAYSQIWTELGSPLILSSMNIRKKLEEKTGWKVALAMRYEDPSIKSALINLKEEGYKKIYVIPLYPHYAMSTVLTTQLEVQRAASEMYFDVSFEFVDHFYNHPDYIDALAESISPYVAEEYDKIVFSYHGIPKRHIRKTDITKGNCLANDNCCYEENECRTYCYKAHVIRTTELVADALEIEKDKWEIAFQSRIGPGWLKPFTDKRLAELPKSGAKSIAILCPSFISDCLETLEEINIRGRETFMQSGGESMKYIPCLNDSDKLIKLLESIIVGKKVKKSLP